MVLRTMSVYTPSPSRYEVPNDWFRRCGRSGLKLPAISLGCWHNFGAAGTDSGRTDDETAFHQNCRDMLFTAFDHGITHFDLANNYGPPPGSAETRVGRILRADFAAHRDELIISSKAGYTMWDGPYGDFGSRKYLLASLDQSLKRLGLDYVDIFYSHRPDPETPLEETMGALDTAVRSGRALYAGLSNYSAERTRDALRVCRENGFMRPIIHQPNYSMLNRKIEDGTWDATDEEGMGIIAFGPLRQGLLSGKYLDTIPEDSRAASDSPFLKANAVSADLLSQLRALRDLAAARGQSLAQMALRWAVRDPRVSSALIGASRPSQIVENVKALDGPDLGQDELAQIDAIL